jgi:hypothetical protein
MLAKDKSKVSLGQKSVNLLIVQSNQLVEDVLKDSSDFSEREHVIFP